MRILEISFLGTLMGVENGIPDVSLSEGFDYLAQGSILHQSVQRLVLDCWSHPHRTPFIRRKILVLSQKIKIKIGLALPSLMDVLIKVITSSFSAIELTELALSSSESKEITGKKLCEKTDLFFWLHHCWHHQSFNRSIVVRCLDKFLVSSQSQEEGPTIVCTPHKELALFLCFLSPNTSVWAFNLSINTTSISRNCVEDLSVFVPFSWNMEILVMHLEGDGLPNPRKLESKN